MDNNSIPESPNPLRGLRSRGQDTTRWTTNALFVLCDDPGEGGL